ncbi:MAG: hypothetical protein GWO86_02200, partial [Planctomycetes bacterium]|nr:hypothetical protein [Planctomycetota bacterium]
VFLCGGEKAGAIAAGSEVVKDYAANAKAIQIVESGLSDKNPYIRTKAIEVVSTCEITSLMPQLLHLAKDPVVPVRFSAVLAIGDRKYRRGMVVVEQLLGDENKNVRIAAAYSMVKLGEPGFIRNVRDAMKDDDVTVMSNAAWLLGKLGDKKSLPMLYAAKDNLDMADRVRFQAVEAIARIGDEKIYPKIWTMLVSKYADDRAMGIGAMGALASAKASSAIISMLDDGVPEVRLAAAKQLGILNDKRGGSVVEEYFKKPPPQRSAEEIERQDVLAAMAIGRIRAKYLRPHLSRLIKSQSQQVRLAAAEAVLLLNE